MMLLGLLDFFRCFDSPDLVEGVSALHTPGEGYSASSSFLIPNSF